MDRDLTAPNPAASFAYLDEASGKEKEAELQRQNHRYRATYQEGSPPKKHESMPWLKDRNLGPGDYEHRDPWEVEQTCGFVPASSMFSTATAARMVGVLLKIASSVVFRHFQHRESEDLHRGRLRSRPFMTGIN